MKQNCRLGKSLKEEFPIFKNNIVKNNPLIYLDSAVSAQKPQAVIQAMTHHMEHDYGSVHRGAYRLSATSSQQYEQVRSKTAAFISPLLSPDQVVFTRGTTESLNLLAHGFSHHVLQEDDRIVLPMSEHHSNLVPWQQAALHANCEIAYIPFEGKQNNQLCINIKEAEKLISKNTKVVTLATMGNGVGQLNPAPEIIAMAKKVGAYVFLDCAQGASCLEDDYFAMGVDALAFSGHKLYGPSGIGVLALSKELSERLPPFLFGGGMVSSVTLEESHWTSTPSKFEAGTPPITEVIGLGAALDWVSHIGRNAIHNHARQLAHLFKTGLLNIPNIEVFSPSSGHETIVSFKHKKIHAHDFVTLLDNDNVSMRAGHHCAWPLMQFLGVEALVRASFAAYSDEDDVSRALQSIKNATKFNM